MYVWKYPLSDPGSVFRHLIYEIDSRKVNQRAVG